jgi:hypothetical protein
MRSLEELIDATAQAEGFSGVVRLDWRGRSEVDRLAELDRREMDALAPRGWRAV